MNPWAAYILGVFSGVVLVFAAGIAGHFLSGDYRADKRMAERNG